MTYTGRDGVYQYICLLYVKSAPLWMVDTEFRFITYPLKLSLRHSIGHRHSRRKYFEFFLLK